MTGPLPGGPHPRQDAMPRHRDAVTGPGPGRVTRRPAVPGPDAQRVPAPGRDARRGPAPGREARHGAAPGREAGRAAVRVPVSGRKSCGAVAVCFRVALCRGAVHGRGARRITLYGRGVQGGAVAGGGIHDVTAQADGVWEYSRARRTSSWMCRVTSDRRSWK